MNRWNRIFRAQRARSSDGAGDFNSDVPERIKITLTDVGYYETLSSRYGTAQTLGIVLLALYLCLTLMTNPALLASERLTYFVKDMVTAASLWDGAADDTLTYTADGQGTQLLFRDGLVAVSESDVTLFSSTGRQLYSEDLHYASPVTCASGRYLIIYDLGGKEYSVYYVKYSGNPTSVPVPKNSNYTISGDNMNGFIVTVEK